MRESEYPYILDASVIIDFYKADKEFFARLHKIGNLLILDVVLAEVKEPHLDNIESYGFTIIETEIDVLLEASALSDISGLSLQDAVCLYISKYNSYCCVTNDKALLNKCKSEKVEVLWGLELLLIAFRKKVIGYKKAVEIASKIKDINFKISDKIIEEFIGKLKDLILK